MRAHLPEMRIFYSVTGATLLTYCTCNKNSDLEAFSMKKKILLCGNLTLVGMPQYKHLSSLPGLRSAGSIKSGRLVAART